MAAAAGPVKKRAKLEDEFIERITCPICLTVMMDNIYQCHIGHVFCGICRDKIHHCPSCRSVLGVHHIRAVMIEQMREYVEIKCKNDDCKEVTLGQSAYKTHEKNCKYNKCNNPGCGFMGCKLDLMNHKQICKYRSFGCPLFILGINKICNHTIAFQDIEKHMTTEHKAQATKIELGKPLTIIYRLDKRDNAIYHYTYLDNGDKFITKIIHSSGGYDDEPMIKIAVRSIGTANYKCKLEIIAQSQVKKTTLCQMNNILPIDTTINGDPYDFDIHAPFDKLTTLVDGIRTLTVLVEVFD